MPDPNKQPRDPVYNGRNKPSTSTPNIKLREALLMREHLAADTASDQLGIGHKLPDGVSTLDQYYRYLKAAKPIFFKDLNEQAQSDDKAGAPLGTYDINWNDPEQAGYYNHVVDESVESPTADDGLDQKLQRFFRPVWFGDK